LKSLPDNSSSRPVSPQAKPVCAAAFPWRRNIYALYVLKLSKWLMLIMPIVALFYNENGLDAASIYLLQAVYSLSVAFLEIPSGYTADIIGRRKSLILGSILGTLGFVVYSVSSSFAGFAAAELILGLGGSFISGSDTALLFDTLDAVNRREEYLRFEGRISASGNFAETAAAILGGLLAAAISYRSVYIAQTIIAAVAIPASLLLIEPPVEKVYRRPGPANLLAVCRHALIVNKPLAAAILQSSVTGICTLCMAWTAQIYFVKQGYGATIITSLWVGLNLLLALVSAWTPTIDRLLNPKLALALITIAIPCGYIGLGLLPVIPAICLLFIFYALRGYATPVLKNITNQFCSSDIRATIFSIRSLIIRVGFSILGPAIGALSGHFSLATALICAGIFLTCLSAASGLLLHRRLAENATTQP
jgi:MFS family permease